MNDVSVKIKINSMVSSRLVFSFFYNLYPNYTLAKIAQILILYEFYTIYIPCLLCYFFVISLSTDIVHGKAVQFLLLHEDLSLQYVIPAVSL